MWADLSRGGGQEVYLVEQTRSAEGGKKKVRGQNGRGKARFYGDDGTSCRLAAARACDESAHGRAQFAPEFTSEADLLAARGVDSFGRGFG